MAAKTQLSPVALPGKRYAFTAKTAASVSGKKWWQKNPMVFENMKKEIRPSWQ
jgi:hypothetical protein